MYIPRKIGFNFQSGKIVIPKISKDHIFSLFYFFCGSKMKVLSIIWLDNEIFDNIQIEELISINYIISNPNLSKIWKHYEDFRLLFGHKCEEFFPGLPFPAGNCPGRGTWFPVGKCASLGESNSEILRRESPKFN